MSSPLVSRSPDLQRLHQEGYDIEIRSGYLLVKHVPFATSAREVAFGTLISELSTTGTATPGFRVIRRVWSADWWHELRACWRGG